MKPLKVLTVIGARPQIIKAAALSRAVRNHFSKSIQEIIVHTGQHYDDNMSEVFFRELEIPAPAYNLEVGSASHARQTAHIIEKLEPLLLQEKPDVLVVYGDTNSTLAAAITAAKLHIPIAHIEAGLRSFNKQMPEELNRILCDHCSSLLFAPTITAIRNLENEGFSLINNDPYTADNPGIFHCGDIMYDNSMYFAEKAMQLKADFLESKNLEAGNYILCTIHRDSNTDNPARLQSIFNALLHIAKEDNEIFYLPLHPRTSKLLRQNLGEELYKKLISKKNIIIDAPASFLEMILLEKHACLIITDSGGLQKEAYFFEKPSIILRAQTEWVEIVEQAAAILADADFDKIIAAKAYFDQQPPIKFPPIFGDGNAAVFIAEQLLKIRDSTV